MRGFLALNYVGILREVSCRLMFDYSRSRKNIRFTYWVRSCSVLWLLIFLFHIELAKMS